ncbi:MAG: hypothetical protein IJZ44_01005 [Lachnospiraceae bacterium]|nr:hypothetical protein [Lachnospiraceae bacterium]
MEKTNYHVFEKELEIVLRQWLSKEAKMDFHKTIKNNGVTYQALAIMEKEQNVSPNIRLDHYYASFCEGMCIEEIGKQILEIYEGEKKKQIDITAFLDFSRAKEHIMFRLVHYKRNKKRLEHMPHIRYLDLALTFYFEMDWLPQNHGQASVQIENEHLKLWGIDEGILYDLALHNTMTHFPALHKPMCEVILQMIAGEGVALTDDETYEFQKENGDIPMYVLTNEKSYFGAACLYYPGVLKQLADCMESDLIVLPSSVHEVILLPTAEEDDYQKINEMIRDINMHQVAEEEVLSDHLYYYDREREELWIPDFSLSINEI